MSQTPSHPRFKPRPSDCFPYFFRTGTVVDALEIVMLEAGRVMERGPHAELMAHGGRYAQMWPRQQSGQDG